MDLDTERERERGDAGKHGVVVARVGMERE